MRFLAAMAVFGLHVSTLAPLSHVARLLGAGDTGVSFFFVLSGFVLAWSYRPQRTARQFYRRRVARIYPVYLVALALAAALAILDGSHLRATDALSLAGVQSWVPSTRVFYGVAGGAWSLSDEAFFYLCFPALIVAAERLDDRGRRRAMAGCVLGTWLVALAGSPLHALGFWLHYIAPPARLLEFALGILLALSVRDGAWPRVPFRRALAFAVAAYCATPFLPIAYLRDAGYTLIPYTLLIGAAATWELDGRTTVFARPAAQHLGAWSYSFYLVHQTVLGFALYLGIADPRSSAGVGLVVTAALLASAIALSAALFRWIERPLERRISGSREDPVVYGERGPRVPAHAATGMVREHEAA
jgi:peptidoglycan/LPS O-acetylase OafA/YrhL